MKKIKKTQLWVKTDDLERIKELLRSKGFDFWNESGVFDFHLLTSVLTSLAWIAVIVLISLL